MTRNVKAFSVTREGNLVTMKVEADGFLYYGGNTSQDSAG